MQHTPATSVLFFVRDATSPSTVHFYKGTDGRRRQTSGWRSRGEKQSLSHAAWWSVISLSACQEHLSQSAVEPVAVINDGMLEEAHETRRGDEKDEHSTQSALLQRERSRVRVMDSSCYGLNAGKSGLPSQPSKHCGLGGADAQRRFPHTIYYTDFVFFLGEWGHLHASRK